MALHLRAMNVLYEAMKEKGSMVIVPSTAVETMGLGGQIEPEGGRMKRRAGTRQGVQFDHGSSSTVCEPRSL